MVGSSMSLCSNSVFAWFESVTHTHYIDSYCKISLNNIHIHKEVLGKSNDESPAFYDFFSNCLAVPMRLFSARCPRIFRKLDLSFVRRAQMGDDTGKKIYVPWKKKSRSLEKIFTALEKKFRLLWPCGPLVLWSSGPVVLWSSGPVVLWSCGAVSCGPLALWFWSCGRVVLWPSSPVVLWSCGSGPVVVSCSGPLVLWSPGKGVKRNM